MPTTRDDASTDWDSPPAPELLARVWRKTELACGFVPLAEITADELVWLLARRMGQVEITGAE